MAFLRDAAVYLKTRVASFRKLGFLDYGESVVHVHSSLLNVVLHD